MAASHNIGRQFDKRSFQRRMNTLGAAYRNRCRELISICRAFSTSRASEQIFNQDTKLSEVLQACDDALACVAEEGEGKGEGMSDFRIEMAFWWLLKYEKRFLHCRTVGKRMERAINMDTKREAGTSAPNKFFKLQTTKVVNFRLLTSITATDTQPTIVSQALTDGSDFQEILWNFSRCPGGHRVTLAKNPHFYSPDRLHITSPNGYHDGFITYPVEECHIFQDVDDIYVLTNKPSRIYLEFGKESRAFDNVWKTNGIFIFKSICGKLEGERAVGAPIQGKSYRWCRAEPLPLPNPPNTSAMTTSTTSTSAWVLVEDWKETISHVLNSPDIRIRIEVITRPVPG
jgi:hypothetical protein